MPNYANGKIYKVLNSVDNEIYVGSTVEPLSARMAKHRAKIAAIPHYKLYQHMNNIGKDMFYIELIELCPCSSKEELRAKEGEWIRQVGALNSRIAGRDGKAWYADHKHDISQKAKQFRQDNLLDVRQKDKEYRDRNIERERERDRTRYRNNELRKEDTKNRSKAWKNEHHEHVKQVAKEWRENNKDKKKEQDKAYRETHKEQLQNTHKQWYEANKENVREQGKQYRETNKELIKHTAAMKVLCECGCSIRKGDLPRHQKSNKHTQLMLKTAPGDTSIISGDVAVS